MKTTLLNTKKHKFEKILQNESGREILLVPVDFETGSKQNFMDRAAWFNQDSIFEHREWSIYE